jgi:hypothetical protein
MKTFTIENETNNITVHASADDAPIVLNAEHFSNEAMLAKLAENWPTARLIEIWNSLPGATPVTKFKDRRTAVSRIWKALQSLGEAVHPEAAEPEAEPVTETPRATEAVPATAEVPAAPEAVPEPEATPLAIGPVTSEVPEAAGPAAVAPQTADSAPEEAPASNEATPANDAKAAAAKNPREGSKTSQVIAMLRREGGATMEEIMTAMGWQKHTTRAMLSAGGSLTKNHGLTVTSEKIGDRRTYSIKA